MEDLWTGGSWEQPEKPVRPMQLTGVQGRKRRTRRGRGRKRIVVFMLLLTLIVGVGAVASLERLRGMLPGGGDSGGSDFSAILPESLPYGDLPKAETGEAVTLSINSPLGPALSYSEVFEKNAASIVSVYAYDATGRSEGTGVVLTSDGYVLTNAHVVEGASSAVVLTGEDDRYDVRLVGANAAEDLAVLKIEAQGLKTAEFGDSDLLRVGDQVSAIGNPMGYRLTMTPGIVSALDRELDMDEGTMYLIQTSAAINYGSSGGALLNDRGQVVGITTAKIVTNDGSAEALCFAIPSLRVKYVVERLIAGKEIQTPMLGITVQRDREAGGLRVVSISPDSDALGKLQSGDLIVKANGRSVSTFRDLARIKDLLDVGDTLELVVQRQGQELQVTITLGRDSSTQE